MRMKPGEKAILPVWFRTGLVLALVTTLTYAYTHRITNETTTVSKVAQLEAGALVASQNLHFVDLENGGISVVNADTGSEIERFETGEGGFMRSVMRGFVRERRAQGLGPEVPFELAMFDDGLVSMIDPATTRRVELSAFGLDNVKAFTRLLPGYSDSDDIQSQDAAALTAS